MSRKGGTRYNHMYMYELHGTAVAAAECFVYLV